MGSVRIKMFRQMISESQDEFKELSLQEKKLNSDIDNEEIAKNQAIKKTIKGLYREDKNLEGTIVESAAAKIDKNEEIKLKQEKRVVDEISKRADLNKELERNAEIEATILKWTNYKNKDHEIDDNKIADLEGKVNKLNNETEAMKDFILNLIKKGKLESEELLSNTNLKNRQTAFLEAMAACPPGALHEVREIDELEELKLDRYNGAKAKSVLDPKFFLENSPNHLPQIPKIALAGIRPALISAESYAKITNRE